MKTKIVFEVLYHVADDHPMAGGGPAADGSFVERFRKRADAERFASGGRSLSAAAKTEVCCEARKNPRRDASIHPEAREPRRRPRGGQGVLAVGLPWRGRARSARRL